MGKDLIYVLTQLLLITLYVFDPGWFYFQLADWIRYLALMDVAFGAFVLLVALFNLGTNLTPLPKPKRDGQLVSSGVYHYIRHPIYTGIIFIMAGGSIFYGSAWKLCATGLIWILFYFKSLHEESYLKKKFSNYPEYMQKTGRFFPKIG